MDTTTQDLVTRLRDHARRMLYLDAGTLRSVRADVIAAADALEAAPPADLVALVLEWQRLRAECERDPSDSIKNPHTRRMLEECRAAAEAVAAWRPSAPPEPHHAAIPNTEQA